MKVQKKNKNGAGQLTGSSRPGKWFNRNAFVACLAKVDSAFWKHSAALFTKFRKERMNIRFSWGRRKMQAMSEMAAVDKNSLRATLKV